MSVFDKMLDGRSLYDLAIERIRHYAREDGKNLVAFSGGKDSQCVYHLCKEAGIGFSAQYSVTRFEPPELMAFIREHYPEVTIRRAYRESLLKEIERRGFPTRWTRWCCEAKHTKTEGYDMAFIGVRAEESPRRRDTWRTFGVKQDRTWYCCPVFDWTEADVWEYLNARGIPHCRLYDEGYSRIGCVLCPLVSNPEYRKRDAERYPKHVAMFRKAAKLFVERMRRQGFVTMRGRKCGSWVDAECPEEEVLRRWVARGTIMMSVEEYDAWCAKRTEPEGQCVFEGSGFSEKDGTEGEET